MRRSTVLCLLFLLVFPLLSSWVSELLSKTRDPLHIFIIQVEMGERDVGKMSESEQATNYKYHGIYNANFLQWVPRVAFYIKNVCVCVCVCMGMCMGVCVC
jgi:hypothetical protein